VINNWVHGPDAVTEKTIDVFEGTVVALLRNGEIYDVRGPGRHGGLWRALNEDRRLPIIGSLTKLTFDRVPGVSDLITTQVRLSDGSTVNVTVQAAIAASWEHKPEAVLDIVRRYGVNPQRIQENAQLDLDDSLRVMVHESLRNLTHNEVHEVSDYQSLMRIPAPRGPLIVERLVSCTVSRDAHEEQYGTTLRDARIARVRAGIEAQLDGFRAENQNHLAAIRQQGELKRRAIEAQAQAELDVATAKLLGIGTIDVRYPDQRAARLAAQYEMVRSIFADNMDLLPLLADPNYTPVLAGLFGSIGLDPAHLTTQASGQIALTSRPNGQHGVRVFRRAIAKGPCGSQEALLVEADSDRYVGSIGTEGPHRLLVGIGDDPVDVALRALRSAANWSGAKVAVRVLDRASGDGPGRVAITRVEEGDSDPDLVASAIGSWVLAINAMLGGSAEVVLDA